MLQLTMTIMHLTVKKFVLSTLLFGISTCHAAQIWQPLFKHSQQLPDLSANHSGSARIHLNEHSAGIAYADRDRKWDAKLDAYQQLHPSLNVDYGALLTGKLGAGVTLNHRRDQTEVLVNGVYAYKHNVYLRLSGGQLWSLGDKSDSDIMQSSLLFAARKVWNMGHLLSDLELAAYSVEAGAGTAAPSSLPDLAIASDRGDMEAGAGRLDGYTVQVGLRPEFGTRIELQRDSGHIIHQVNRAMRNEATSASNRITYSKQFDNCVRLHTGLHSNTDTERVDVGVATRDWRFTVSHAKNDAGTGDTTVYVGYSIPLTGKQQPPAACKRPPEGPSAFEPVVSAAIRRPPQLPQAPLVRGLPRLQ